MSLPRTQTTQLHRAVELWDKDPPARPSRDRGLHAVIQAGAPHPQSHPCPWPRCKLMRTLFPHFIRFRFSLWVLEVPLKDPELPILLNLALMVSP